MDTSLIIFDLANGYPSRKFSVINDFDAYVNITYSTLGSYLVMANFTGFDGELLTETYAIKCINSEEKK